MVLASQSISAENPQEKLPGSGGEAVQLREFIFESAPFPSCHASTIAETPAGPVAAWFGGTREKHPDVGIWFSRREEGTWTSPVEVATGVDPNGRRYPCWNPVLYQVPGGDLLLFYKVGPDPEQWWGMLMASGDGGRNWCAPKHLPDGFLGPIKNKPIAVAGSALLCPSSTEHNGWRIHFEITPDLGATWRKTAPATMGRFEVIQPTLLVHPDGRLQALCRSEQGRVVQTWSADSGETWGPLEPTSLPNPNAGIDGVTLSDRRHLLVYNHVAPKAGESWGPRTPLNLAVSPDGLAWKNVLELENAPGEYSYPAIIQGRDGFVHITYTWKRERIRYLKLDPSRIRSGE